MQTNKVIMRWKKRTLIQFVSKHQNLETIKCKMPKLSQITPPLIHKKHTSRHRKNQVLFRILSDTHRIQLEHHLCFLNHTRKKREIVLRDIVDRSGVRYCKVFHDAIQLLRTKVTDFLALECNRCY